MITASSLSQGTSRTHRGAAIVCSCVIRPLLVAAAMAGAPMAVAWADTTADVDFTDLSLEELMNVEVTSVSKRRQRLADAAAAVFVISQEDIRRSGATNVPELLRIHRASMSPGSTPTSGRSRSAASTAASPASFWS